MTAKGEKDLSRTAIDSEEINFQLQLRGWTRKQVEKDLGLGHASFNRALKMGMMDSKVLDRLTALFEAHPYSAIRAQLIKRRVEERSSNGS